jgi:hypothetical protein
VTVGYGTRVTATEIVMGVENNAKRECAGSRENTFHVWAKKL